MGFPSSILDHLSPDVVVVDERRAVDYTNDAIPVPAAARRRGGRRAQAGGRKWEDVIRQENLLLPPEVTIIKTDPPSRIIKRGNQLAVIYEKDGPPDWAGAAYNFPIFFESKSTTGNTWAVSKPTAQDKGNWHQWEFLQRVQTGNPRAFCGYYIFWSDKLERRFHFLSAFTPDGKTQRVSGIPVASWFDAFLLWCKEKRK